MTESTTSSPHDAVFKTFMFTPETARDFLEIHLPEPLRKLCNLQTLRLEPTSFIEKSLRAYYSDVLWSVETSDGDGYIYCVIEHQSSAEKNMAFRLMRYATAAMQRHLDKGYDRVPLVVPLLFIMAKHRPTRTHLTGWMSLTIRNLPGSCTPKLFRWWISPSYLTMRSCNIGV